MTPATKAQASVLASRYAMPIRTVLDWMEGNAIEGYNGWTIHYGPHRFATNEASHDACLTDIQTWVLSAD